MSTTEGGGRRHGRVLEPEPEPATAGTAEAPGDGRGAVDADEGGADGRGPDADERPRRRGPVFFLAIGVAVVLAVFVGVLATRDPSSDRTADSPLVGQVAPPVTGKSLTDGQAFDLDALRGQWVVLNFFATWCVPCRTEHPELLSFSRRHSQIGDASVVSVVFDDDPEAVKQYFEDNDSTWPVVDGTGTGVILDYAVAAVPESFIISPSGYVVAKVTGGVTSVGLDQLIADLSGEQPATEGGGTATTQAPGTTTP